MFSIQELFREQRRPLPQPNAVGDVSSKTFIVTGSNVGLGFEASIHLAKMKPELLLATSRDLAKCEHTREAILERVAAESVPVGESSPEVTAWPLDLGSFENVRAFVNKFEAEGSGGLNAIIVNAGMFSPDYTQTQDGWEIMLQVNYLSNALLSILLLPCLVNSSTTDSPSRLVLVSSFGHYLGASSLKKADKWSSLLETVNSEQFGSGVTRYNVSKLFEVMFIRELAARLPDPTPVVASTVNPGYCESRLFRSIENKWYLRHIYPAVKRLFCVRSTEEGSRSLVHAAVAGEERSMHGRYLSVGEIAGESDFLFTPQGKAFSARLWDETIAVLSQVDGRVSDILSKYLGDV